MGTTGTMRPVIINTSPMKNFSESFDWSQIVRDISSIAVAVR